MKLATLVKCAVGSGVGLAGLMMAAPATALAAPAWGTGSCTQQALVAAVKAANAAGGGTINLARGCHYRLKTADNGENGLPVVMTRIRVNGNDATIDGTGAVR